MQLLQKVCICKQCNLLADKMFWQQQQLVAPSWTWTKAWCLRGIMQNQQPSSDTKQIQDYNLGRTGREVQRLVGYRPSMQALGRGREGGGGFGRWVIGRGQGGAFPMVVGGQVHSYAEHVLRQVQLGDGLG